MHSSETSPRRILQQICMDIMNTLIWYVIEKVGGKPIDYDICLICYIIEKVGGKPIGYDIGLNWNIPIDEI